MSCGIGYRCGSDLVLLWYRLAAVALFIPLAWEPPYATGTALKKKKKRKKEIKKNVKETLPSAKIGCIFNKEGMRNEISFVQREKGILS